MNHKDPDNSREPDIIEVECRPVKPPVKKNNIFISIWLPVVFLGGAAVLFWTSGILNWWELKRFGRRAQATVVGLDFRTSTLGGESSSFNLLTVGFRDESDRYHEVKITDVGRFAREHHINPHNPSLPKETVIVYSSRNPDIAELRDYRNHGWSMFIFSILVAAMYPVLYFLILRESRRAAA